MAIEQTPENLQKFAEILKRNGNNAQAAGDEFGLHVSSAKRWRKKLREQNVDPSIQNAAAIGGIENTNLISGFWKIVKDEDGNGHSIYVKNPDAGGGDISLADMVRETIEESIASKPLKFEKRKKEPTGENLLIMDLADVHVRKLCTKSETGYEYNMDVARHRIMEGTKALLKAAKPMGINKILYVTGNDSQHTDNAQNTTTSGTRQDTDGTPFQGFKVGQRAFTDSINLCAKIADVDILHCMSNHDWLMGWAMSQAVAAMFANHPNVNASEYNLSERHRKYYRFGNNLFGLSHGDGAKEEKLYGLMVTEAREHISECLNLYWILHHNHHKMRRSRDGNKPFLQEKDHNGMTAIIAGDNQIEGEKLNIEYVRSPSPPDGWHDRNGYVNRQAVEAFVYHPHEGLKARFTEFF